MGLFKNKKKTFVSPEWGEFALVFVNGENRIWSTKKDGISYTVRGTDDQPHAEQVAFLSKVKSEMEKLDKAITEMLLKELTAEGMKTGFNRWQERFSLTNIEVIECSENSPQWNIYLRDSKKGVDLTLFIEGNNITRCSIDP